MTYSKLYTSQYNSSYRDRAPKWIYRYTDRNDWLDNNKNTIQN